MVELIFVPFSVCTATLTPLEMFMTLNPSELVTKLK